MRQSQDLLTILWGQIDQVTCHIAQPTQCSYVSWTPVDVKPHPRDDPTCLLQLDHKQKTAHLIAAAVQHHGAITATDHPL